MVPQLNRLPDLISAEQAAGVLDLPMAAIGRLVQMDVLHFYRGLTFLRADVQRVLTSNIKILPDLRRECAPPPPPPVSPWHLCASDE